MRGAGRNETEVIARLPASMGRVRVNGRLAPLEHPSSVSALRADPPSPTRGEGKPLAFPRCRDRFAPNKGGGPPWTRKSSKYP
ncbi:hypothetical protein FJ414_01955 [Mesorhizobium sp. B3-1-6]|nr:hypothetical protein FJ414_01955 [Mesorhizobium sp. B3-1-6]